jgi:very-short-patch-repair endonuclease
MDQATFTRHLRQNMTDCERRLWRCLRANRFMGQKFRRQQPLGPFVVDFVHFGGRLVVEADGGQHAAPAADLERDAWLRGQGFRVLRFWNHDIAANLEGVLQEILQALEAGGRGGFGAWPPLPNPYPGTSVPSRGLQTSCPFGLSLSKPCRKTLALPPFD